ncbi:hypothetical protein HYW76_04905 [Candidatus Pacearchaeota archaeon]|nr:hypothetical protein [Candidatus Pacearchaeota archaeon]
MSNMTTEEEKEIDNRKDKLLKVLLGSKYLLAIVGLIVLLLVAWHLRTVNVPNLKDVTTGDYTLGPDLDPFLFLRYAEYIVEHGSLMSIDNMRYVPRGYDTAGETKLLPYMMAYFYESLSLFSKVSINYSAVIFPAFMFLLTVIAFFLFIRKVFEDNKKKDLIAIISSAFLIVAPSLLPRTVAGIPEKESAGFFFLFLAFYFFISAWKAQKLKSSIIWGALAGIATALMGLIWGGWIYIFVTISVFVFFNYLFSKIDNKKLASYFSWIALSYVIPVMASQRYTIKDLIASTSTGLAAIILGLLVVDYAIFNTKIKDIKFIAGLRQKIPDKAITLIGLIIAGIVVSSVMFGIGFIPEFIGDIFFHLTQPYSDRLSFTVAENRQPFFDEWGGNFGPIVGGIPLLFWIFFIGSIFLFYDVVKNIERKNKIIMTITYVLFIFGLVFSRYTSTSVMNGTSMISKLVYFGSFALFGLVIVYMYYKGNKDKKLEDFEKINFSYLILLCFFITSLIGARSAIRLIMVLAPPIAGIVGYFVISLIDRTRESKGENMKILLLIVTSIIIIASVYSFWNNYQATLNGANSMIPSMYTQQWQKAMEWVRNSTSENAVFAHWWDYGYWIQSIGRRATVLDGGNAIGYWNHLIGRHVLTGQNEKEALEFLYAHNATHLLIDSTEIGKYPAYSTIGSDENYDRYSQISIFIQDESNIQETKEEIVFVYQGGMFLDRDYILKDNATGNTQIFPAYKTGIGAVFLRATKDGFIKQPEAVFVYQNKQTSVPMKCVYFNGQVYNFKEGYGGCLYIVPRIVNSNGQMGVNERGAGLFITEKSMNALWIKLYLFNQTENFNLVRNEPNYIVENLKSQGIKIGDFIFYNEMLGPIKIWEINYPKDTEFKPEYLSIDYPENILHAKEIF